MLDDIEWLESDDSERFKRRLIESVPTVERIADWYRSQGYEVKVPPISIRPHRGAWRKHSDKGDMFVAMEIWMPVEVKGRSFDFTSRDDFPFRDGAFVCHCRAFDEAHPKPLAIVHTNKARTHVAIIFSYTHTQWRKDWVEDGGMDDVNQHTYVAPLDCIEFLELK